MELRSGNHDMRIEERPQGCLSEMPDSDEIKLRILNHLRYKSTSVEVKHLWTGYLAALLEWGLIDRPKYVALSKLIGRISTEELYQLFADEPMPAMDDAR